MTAGPFGVCPKCGASLSSFGDCARCLLFPDQPAQASQETLIRELAALLPTRVERIACAIIRANPRAGSSQPAEEYADFIARLAHAIDVRLA